MVNIIIIRKQIVYKHLIYQLLNISTCLSNILINSFSQFYWFLQVYKISYIIGLNFPFYTMSSVKEQV